MDLVYILNNGTYVEERGGGIQDFIMNDSFDIFYVTYDLIIIEVQ